MYSVEKTIEIKEISTIENYYKIIKKNKKLIF